MGLIQLSMKLYWAKLVVVVVVVVVYLTTNQRHVGYLSPCGLFIVR